MPNATSKDPKARFSNRADDYVQYRPSYPVELFDWLVAKIGSQRTTRPLPRHVVDVGAGTGISTKPLLERGYRVTAVEPNSAMRDHLLRLQEQYPSLTICAGDAESTGLSAAIADLLLAAQAFHWFDAAAFRREAMRVLSPGGGVALVWNDRRTDDSDFSLTYEALLLESAPDYAAVSHKWTASQEKIAEFFDGANVHAASFDNMQAFDERGLQGRARSSSYVPAQGTPGHDEFYEKLHELFAKYAKGDTVHMVYRTRVWYGAFPAV